MRIPLRSGRTLSAVSLLLFRINYFIESPEDFELERSILEMRDRIKSLLDSVPDYNELVVNGHLHCSELVCSNLIFLAEFAQNYLLEDDVEAILALGGLQQIISGFLKSMSNP